MSIAFNRSLLQYGGDLAVGSMAVFLAEPIADTLAGSTTLFLFLKEYRKKLFV